jgi:hypothetical protein
MIIIRKTQTKTIEGGKSVVHRHCMVNLTRAEPGDKRNIIM